MVGSQWEERKKIKWVGILERQKTKKKKNAEKARLEKLGLEGKFIFATRILVPQGLFPPSNLITKCVGWSNTSHLVSLTEAA